MLRQHADIRPACELHTHRLWWKSPADRDGDGNAYANSDGNTNGYLYLYGKRCADSHSGTAQNSDTASAANPGASP